MTKIQHLHIFWQIHLISLFRIKGTLIHTVGLTQIGRQWQIFLPLKVTSIQIPLTAWLLPSHLRKQICWAFQLCWVQDIIQLLFMEYGSRGITKWKTTNSNSFVLAFTNCKKQCHHQYYLIYTDLMFAFKIIAHDLSKGQFNGGEKRFVILS